MIFYIQLALDLTFVQGEVYLLHLQSDFCRFDRNVERDKTSQFTCVLYDKKPRSHIHSD